MSNSAKFSGKPSSSGPYAVGDVVQSPPGSSIAAWRYLGNGEWMPDDVVRVATGPGGGIEFPGVAPLTAAVRNAVQYIVSQADLDARPPRLWPVDAVPYAIMAGWNGAAWGSYDSASRTIVRVDAATRAATQGYTFPVGVEMRAMFAGHNSLLVMTETIADETFQLWRTVDGSTVTHVHDLGRDPDGAVHRPNVQLLAYGLTPGYIDGQPALVLATYSIVSDAVIGTPEDAIYIAYSMDDGATWQRLNTWSYDFALGSGARKIRHFHAIRYDRWRDCWWIAAGDADDQAAIIRWDGKSMAAIGNRSPAEIASGSYTGWMCRGGSQRWRAVDLIVTEDWIESYTDTFAEATGGIWRVRPDFTGNHRVNHDMRGMERDGWFGLLTSGGTRIWTSNVRVEEVDAAGRYIGVYASQNGNRYWEVGQVQAKPTGKCNPRALFELSGLVWLCTTGNVGKATGDTTVFELRGKFREERADNLAPAFFVDFATGVDSTNVGGSQATAFRTLKHALQASRVTYGARIMLSAGTSEDPGFNTIVYDDNATPAGNTARHVQVSGQGARGAVKTRINLPGTLGMRGANSKLWNVELTDLELVQINGGPSPALHDYSTSVAGSGWAVRDCVIGDIANSISSLCLFNSTAFTSVRSLFSIAANGTNRALRTESTGTATLSSSVFRGIVGQGGASTIQARHCEFGNAGTANAFRIESTSTVPPVIANCTFSSASPAAPILNESAQTLTSADIFGCAYSTPGAVGIPAPLLPVAGIMDREEDSLTPFAWSALAGVAQPAGVSWDYYGNPFRARPAIGAVEIPPTF